MKKGWFGDSWRHSLSAKGIKTTNSKNSYYQRRIIKGSITEMASQAGRKARKELASRDVRTPAELTARVAEGTLLTTEEKLNLAEARKKLAEQRIRRETPRSTNKELEKSLRSLLDENLKLRRELEKKESQKTKEAQKRSQRRKLTEIKMGR